MKLLIALSILVLTSLAQADCMSDMVQDPAGAQLLRDIRQGVSNGSIAQSDADIYISRYCAGRLNQSAPNSISTCESVTVEIQRTRDEIALNMWTPAQGRLLLQQKQLVYNSLHCE